MKRTILFLIGLIVIGLYSNLKAQPGNLSQGFLHAQQLINSNCGDCIGGTQEGLEEGIAELISVIRAGYKNEFEAYKLLVYAYKEMAAVYAVPDSAAKENYRAEYKKALKKLLTLAPNDPNLLYEHALTLRDDRELQLAEFQKVLGIDPNNIDARFAAASILVEKGNVNEGIYEIKETLKRAKGNAFISYGYQASDIYEKLGRKKEAEEVRLLIEKMRRQEKLINEGRHEIQTGDANKGIKLIYESVEGDLSKLSEWDKTWFADELEKKHRYKESADLLELVDPEKYKEKIMQLKEKAKGNRKQ